MVITSTSFLSDMRSSSALDCGMRPFVDNGDDNGDVTEALAICSRNVFNSCCNVATIFDSCTVRSYLRGYPHSIANINRNPIIDKGLVRMNS